MNCALFGNNAHELNACLGSGNKNEAIVVLQFTRMKLFNEKILLQNFTYGTKMFFNLKDENNLLLEFSNEIADNGDSEVLENAITPTKRLSLKSEDSG
ncbi:hypothetical protein Ahy_B04g072275 [Arachis hypogaea]|uniref:Uncharacterized protein n=1 Tax=Arachis hypogaea TaxID=3818 RepID=A0A444ZMS6_ARAHY|nr:hypothetical protein Ahy_B04g072275 [Arachis hypogaea]